MRKTKEQIAHEKAVRLHEGGVVQISGHAVRAIEIQTDALPCMDCQMDSACTFEMEHICLLCDEYSHTTHILEFAHPTK